MAPNRCSRLATLLVATALLVTACGEDANRAGDVRAAIDAARAEPYRFVYTEDNPDGRFVVRGLVEDDFRYKAQLSVEGDDVYEEIALDDGLAVRLRDRSYLPELVDDEMRGVADTDTDVEGIDVLSALAARRWVVDPEGAPSQTAPERGLAQLGTDPVFDAFSAFEYVEQAVRQSANQVIEYTEEQINPTYRRTEDIFAPPEDGSGVVRYDLRRPSLPTAADLISASETSPPSTRHFRKMAIYVKDGRIIRVEERVEVVGSFFADFIDYQREILDAIDAPPEAYEGFDEYPDELPESMPIEDQVRWSNQILEDFNEFLEIRGSEPIRIRHMILDLQDFGSDITIELPEGEDVLTGSLAILRSRGRKPPADVSAAGS